MATHVTADDLALANRFFDFDVRAYCDDGSSAVVVVQFFFISLFCATTDALTFNRCINVHAVYNASDEMVIDATDALEQALMQAHTRSGKQTKTSASQPGLWW
jgi:hypothetical protein